MSSDGRLKFEDRMTFTRSASGRLPHHQVMGQLKRRLARIAEVIPVSRPIVYLDYPVHNNVGDLLIHQGADAFLEDYGYNVRGRFSMHDFAVRSGAGTPHVALKPSIKELDALLARRGCTLVLHGGGNIGDIWPHFQMFRELIVQRYLNTPTVVLPQSIHFGDPRARERAARIFAEHPQLFVFVRDAESLRFVRDDCGLLGEMMPDMAHQLWGRPQFAPSDADGQSGELFMRRRDRESANPGRRASSFDWDELNGMASNFTLRGLRKLQTIDSPLRHWVSNYRLWCMFRDRLISRAIEQFRPYGCINTDRLHGMILGALMSKRVRYGEGTYGKLHRYASVWLADSCLIENQASDQVVA
jgi:pyruvyl transferase EpsO